MKGNIVGKVKYSGALCIAAYLTAIPLHGAPYRLLAIGDPLTEEYRLKTPYSVPTAIRLSPTAPPPTSPLPLHSASLIFPYLNTPLSKNDWILVPLQNIQLLHDGTVNLIPSVPKLFYKFAANPKP